VNRRALILAAHGSGREPPVNARIRAMAGAIASRGLFGEVVAAFHQGEPRFSNVIDMLACEEAIVVPVMTSDGYYCDGVLPGELAKNERIRSWDEGADSSGVRVMVTKPVGTHPRMLELVARRAACLMNEHGLEPTQTSVAVIGHGTPRHARSRSSTVAVAESLARRGIAGDCFAAFIDEEPFLEAVTDVARNTNILVLLFLINPGPHALCDVPYRIGFPVEGHPRLPRAARIGNRFVLCDEPVGILPGFLDVILQLARPPRPCSADAPTEGGSQARAGGSEILAGTEVES
jgi:sirohydrochlorin cobaltochelatase